MSKKTENVFGTGITYDGYGILLRGQSGAGKSLLALDLLDRAETQGLEAFLISDDRVLLHVEDGAVICKSPPQIAGQIELRGCGVIERATTEQTKVNLVIDLLNELDRMPENEEFETELMGVKIPRCPVPIRSLIDSVHQRLLVIEAIKRVQQAENS
ncbi:HPr kinase/phosphorylase [Maritalea sp.]|jgi:serine kinase of HPr protein (carbohydrate metabolism regulator)|uniref:HPr kinase/phosphorylase n=1 Tax=Maritalea sp. TaxID=2003361 RepID=UPI0039E58322